MWYRGPLVVVVAVKVVEAKCDVVEKTSSSRNSSRSYR